MELFITTYALYNNGMQFANSNSGAWYEIDGSITYEELVEKLSAVQVAMGLGSDVELMATDYQDGPKCLYEESMNWDNFEWIQKYNDLSDDAKVGFRYLCEDVGLDIEDSLAKAEEVQFSTESAEDYAYNYVNECYDLKSLGRIANYIDYDDLARDMKLEGSICEFEGYLITNCQEF
jgi:hypothetical protein